MLCRLCLVEPTIEVINIFDNEGLQLQIANIITKHFWFSPSKDDPISDKICCSCWSKVDSFHQFYCFVEESQKNLVNITQTIINSSVLPVALGDLKKEQIFCDDDNLDKEINDDWKIQSSPTILYEDVKINKENSLTDPNMGVQVENDSNLKEETAGDLLHDKETVKSRKQKRCSRSKKNHKAKGDEGSSDNEKLDIEEEENQTDSDIVLSEIKSKKSSLYKKPRKQRQKVVKRSKNNTVNNDFVLDDIELENRFEKQHDKSESKRKDIEKLEIDKKMKDEDELIAKFIRMICDMCNKEFETFLKLRSHFRSDHKKKNGYVVCCNKKIFCRLLLLDHVNYHLNPDAFKCIHCNKKFKGSHILKNHIAYSHESDDSKLLKCSHCDKKFINQSILERHKLIHIPAEEKQFQCDICNKSYPSKYHLNIHKTTVHDRQYHLVCDICAKKIPCKKLLEKHRLEHKGIVEPKAQCQKCGSWFKNEKLLKRHLQRHEEALMGLKCDICGKVSPSKNALRSHIKFVHKKEKTHKCTFCEKGFKHEVALKEHIMTHTGGALYMCPYCPKTFNSNANMHTHKKRTHPNEWEEERKQRLALAAAQTSVLVAQNVAVTESN